MCPSVRAHLAHYFPRQTSNIAPASFPPPIPTSKIQTSRRQTLADESRWQPLQVPSISKHLKERQTSNVLPKISSLIGMYLSIRDVTVCGEILDEIGVMKSQEAQTVPVLHLRLDVSSPRPFGPLLASFLPSFLPASSPSLAQSRTISPLSEGGRERGREEWRLWRESQDLICCARK